MAAPMKRTADRHLAPASKKFKDDSAAKIGEEAYNNRLQLAIAMVKKTTAKVAPARAIQFIESAPAPTFLQQRKRQPEKQLQHSKERRVNSSLPKNCNSRPNSSSYAPALEKKSSCNNRSTAARQDALLPLSNQEVAKKKGIAAPSVEALELSDSNSSSSDSVAVQKPVTTCTPAAWSKLPINDLSLSESSSSSSGESSSDSTSDSESEEEKEDVVAAQKPVTARTPAAWPKLPVVSVANSGIFLSGRHSDPEDKTVEQQQMPKKEPIKKSTVSSFSGSDSESLSSSLKEEEDTAVMEVKQAISDVPKDEGKPTAMRTPASQSSSSSDSDTESPFLNMNKKPSLILVLRRRRDGPTPTWFVHHPKDAE